MQKTTIREFRRTLKAHLESTEATIITSGRGWRPTVRAILVPIPTNGEYWKPGPRRAAIAQAKRQFKDAIAQAH